MLRIFFSREDIARTRLAPAADPIWELVLSLHLLRGTNADPMISGWRRRVGDRLRERAIAEQVRLFVAAEPAARLLSRLPHARTRACAASTRGWRRSARPRPPGCAGI